MDGGTPEMKPSRILGIAAAVLAAQFFVAQAVVQSAWTTPFSLAKDYISDLGNTTCGPFRVGDETLFVCSPLHAWMNASFAGLGAAILLGAWLAHRMAPAGRARSVAIALLVFAGPGPILVALFPEDQDLATHKVGAGMQFIGGNLGLIVLGIALARDRLRASAWTIACGAIGLAATALFVAEVYLGIAIGGMERVACYPLPLWLIGTGIRVRS